MKLNELINENYDRLTDNDRQILAYVVDYRQKAAGMGCELLAASCHVSKTTLLRFCKKLGLHSYSELRLLLKTAADSETLPENMEISQICTNYHQMIEDIKNRDYKPICLKIRQAQNIYIYGTGNAQKAEAEEFKRIFLNVGKCVIDLFDLGEVGFTQSAFTPSDLFFIISLSGETKAGIDILRSIEETKIETVSITRWDNNTIARMCQNNLYVGTKTVHGYKNLSYEMTAAFYVLLDILFVNYLDGESI